MAQITNEVLATKIENLGENIKALDARLNAFTPSQILDLKFAEIERDIIQLKRDIAKSNWKSHTLTAVLTFMMTFLAGFFLTNLSGIWR